MSAITSQNVANAIVKLVASEALAPLVGNLVFGNLVNRSYEPVLAQAGDTVNVPIPPSLSANNVAEAGTVTTQNPNLGNAQIVLNTHVEATFQIPDVTKVLAVPDLIKTYMQPAVIAIAEKVETDIASLYSLFTFNTAAGGATAMDEARVDTAETTLFNTKVPASAPLYLVVSGNAFGQLRQLSRFTDYQTVGPTGQPSAQITGMLPGGSPFNPNGRIKNFSVFRSQYIQKPSSTTYNLAFARDAIGLVVRRLPQPLPGTGAIAEYAEMGNFGLRVVMSYQPNSLGQQFTVDALYGVAILRNNFGIQVQSN